MRALRGPFADERVKVIDRHEAMKREQERQQWAKTALKPAEVEELRKRCSLRSGSECRVAITRILGRDYLIRLAKM